MSELNTWFLLHTILGIVGTGFVSAVVSAGWVNFRLRGK